jgi:hypothetical protein
MVDVAQINPPSGGELQPDPGAAWYREQQPDRVFDQASQFWKERVGAIRLRCPDPRWGECLRAMVQHATLFLNENAPDVAVINYNVYNRDGMYIANMLQKAGLLELSGRCLEYFLSNPFNGRAYPEADNPGQILWSLNMQWQFGRDWVWLKKIYPDATKIAELIAYCRTTPEPHWVNSHSLLFGDALPPDKRIELKPGRCDGFHPEYTDAFDVAGLRAAANLAAAAGDDTSQQKWTKLAEQLMDAYNKKYGSALRAKEYGNYSVLWPCALYPYSAGAGWEAFKDVGAQKPASWRYFPLATAHQGLLAGNREAGWQTLQWHLELPLMNGWYVLDEFSKGPGSPSGSWQKVRTKWPSDPEFPGRNHSVAMPHGWAIAEVWLLMRDCLIFEDKNRLVALAGVPPTWFENQDGFEVSGLRTPFGEFGLRYKFEAPGGQLELTGTAAPPDGFVLRLPDQYAAQGIAHFGRNDFVVPSGTKLVKLHVR